MQATAKEVVAQLIVDKSFEDAVKGFSKPEIVKSLSRAIELARSNYHYVRSDRLGRGDKRIWHDERNFKDEAARLQSLLDGVKARADWSPEEEFTNHLLEKWCGGALSGLLFDRKRSTLGRYLQEIAKIEKALETYKAAPIDVDDNGEGSYSGYAFGVYHSQDAWIARYGERGLGTPRHLKPWQWLAGVVAWDRPNFKPTGSPMWHACEPGWHWLMFDDERVDYLSGTSKAWRDYVGEKTDAEKRVERSAAK